MMEYSPNTGRTNKGFTLIELMVSMLLGFFSIAAILTIYSGHKKSYAEQQQFIMLEEAGRSALFELTDILQHAGYRTPNRLTLSNPFITGSVTSESCNTTTSNVANTTIINTVADAASDTIGVVYYGDAGLNNDCSGAQLAADCRAGTVVNTNAAQIYNSFSIATVSGLPELRCSGSLSASPVTLVKGVENIQFLYGVDEDLNGQIDNYMNATLVTSEGAWNSVKAIKVAVLVRSHKAIKDTAVAQSYVLLDKRVNIAADRFHRAVFSTVIRLQNSHT